MFLLRHWLVAVIAVSCVSGLLEARTLTIVGTKPNDFSGEINAALKDAFAVHGWTDLRWISPEDFNSKVLETSELIYLRSLSANHVMTAHEKEIISSLVSYVEAGGGLVFGGEFGQMLNYMGFPMALMRALGGRVLLETAVHHGARLGEYDDDTYAATTKVDPLFAKGVSAVAYVSKFRFKEVCGVNTVLLDDNWKAALSTEDDVKTTLFPATGLPHLDRQIRAQPYAKNVPIVAYRTLGKGRVVWIGTNSFKFLRNTRNPDVLKVEEAVCRGTVCGRPVQTGEFFLNLLDWAAVRPGGLERDAIKPFGSLGDYKARLGTGYALHRGVIGPRTTYSVGKSTVAEYVAKAKELGLDFIVFLEDFSELSEENYERLRLECEKYTDDRFTAWAGYTFETSNGNHQYFFSGQPIYPSPEFLTDDGRKFYAYRKNDKFGRGAPDLDFIYAAVGFNGNSGWYLYNDSPYRKTDQRDVQSSGVITRVNGVTAEVARDVYGMNNALGQLHMPFALELMDDVRYLTDKTWQVVIGHRGLVNFRTMMMSYNGNCHHGYPDECAGNYGAQSVTSGAKGPVIEFAPARADMAGERGQLLYTKQLQSWPYSLKVSAENGIDAVELVDGNTVVRRWNGKGLREFAREGFFTNEKQHHYWVRVKDRKGGEAFTRSCNSDTFLMRELQCPDRNNQLFYSDIPRDDPNEPNAYCTHCADTCTPDKGPWNGRQRPVGYYVFDHKYGLGGDGGFDGSPEAHPTACFTPSVAYGNEKPQYMGYGFQYVAGREGVAHNRPHRVVASGNALVGDRILDGTFEADRRQDWQGSVWSTLFPVEDDRYMDTRARCSLFLPKPDGIFAYQWEQGFSVKTPIPTVANEWFISAGGFSFAADREMKAKLRGKEVSGCTIDSNLHFEPGDYFTLKDKTFGSFALYALTPVDLKHAQMMILGDGKTANAGSQYSFRCVLAGFNRTIADPFAYAEKVGKAFAIGGGTPDYRAELKTGKGMPDGICFNAEAEEGGISGVFRGLKELPGTLGFRLSGLKSSRTAVCAIPGRFRVVPVEQGTAYVALGNYESDQPIFVGSAFRSDSPRLGLFLSLKGDLKTWTLEVHNPTDREIRAKVENDPRFAALAFSKQVVVPPNASVEFDLSEVQ